MELVRIRPRTPTVNVISLLAIKEVFVTNRHITLSCHIAIIHQLSPPHQNTGAVAVMLFFTFIKGISLYPRESHRYIIKVSGPHTEFALVVSTSKICTETMLELLVSGRFKIKW
jgi:hypothetical protein